MLGRWTQRYHVLCLDAASVAMLGYAVVSLVGGARMDAGQLGVIGLTVWLAYVGDRWMDARRNPLAALDSQRHRFYEEHRVGVLKVWVGVFALDILLSVWVLSREAWLYGLLLAVVAVAYTLGAQHRRLVGGTKEFAIGCLFGLVALGLEPWTRDGAGLATAVLFGGVCFSNCLLIGFVERSDDIRRQEVSAFDRAPQWWTWLGLGGTGVLILWAAWVAPWSVVLLFVIYLAGAVAWVRRVRFTEVVWIGRRLDLGLIAVLLVMLMVL